VPSPGDNRGVELLDGPNSGGDRFTAEVSGIVGVSVSGHLSVSADAVIGKSEQKYDVSLPASSTTSWVTASRSTPQRTRGSGFTDLAGVMSRGLTSGDCRGRPVA
jgi:hypothetical protein